MSEIKTKNCYRCGSIRCYNPKYEKEPDDLCESCKDKDKYLDKLSGWAYYYNDSDW